MKCFVFFQQSKVEKPIQLQQLVEKPLEVTTESAKLKEVGWFEPITDDPIYNWIWQDVNYEDNDDFIYHQGLTLFVKFHRKFR